MEFLLFSYQFSESDGINGVLQSEGPFTPNENKHEGKKRSKNNRKRSKKKIQKFSLSRLLSLGVNGSLAYNRVFLSMNSAKLVNPI